MLEFGLRCDQKWRAVVRHRRRPPDLSGNYCVVRRWCFSGGGAVPMLRWHVVMV